MAIRREQHHGDVSELTVAYPGPSEHRIEHSVVASQSARVEVITLCSTRRIWHYYVE